MGSAGQDAAPWTVGRLLTWTQDYLRRSGIESPRLCAEILLAFAMKCERIRVYTCFEQVPGPDVLEAFRELVKLAAAGRPIAHLTGSKEFYSLPFEVTPDVLIPRPETEILVERTIALVRQSPATLRSILDLGTGSGCIVVSLAKHLPGARLAASDVSETALAVARRNAERHGVAGQIEFRCGDLFEPWRGAGGHPRGLAQTFDIIVCNPPYVRTEGAPVAPAVRDYEPHGAVFAGRDGFAVIHRLLRAGPRWLSPGGHLLMEMAFDQAAAVRDLLDRASWKDIVTYRDAAGHERVLHARTAAAGQAQVA